eukprot:5501030-Prymnesium_polylepis.1
MWGEGLVSAAAVPEALRPATSRQWAQLRRCVDRVASIVSEPAADDYVGLAFWALAHTLWRARRRREAAWLAHTRPAWSRSLRRTWAFKADVGSGMPGLRTKNNINSTAANSW